MTMHLIPWSNVPPGVKGRYVDAAGVDRLVQKDSAGGMMLIWACCTDVAHANRGNVTMITDVKDPHDIYVSIDSEDLPK